MLSTYDLRRETKSSKYFYNARPLPAGSLVWTYNIN
jgi:hypothetical protein